MMASATDRRARAASREALEVEDDDVKRRQFTNTVVGLSALAATGKLLSFNALEQIDISHAMRLQRRAEHFEYP
jgi:hypothetical protein